MINSISLNFNKVNNTIVATLALGLLASQAFSQDTLNYRDANTLNKGKLATILVSGAVIYTASMLELHYNEWHHNYERTPFQYYNDFKTNLQVDKFQHAYGSYVESYIGYNALKSAGVKDNYALLFGGTLGFILLTPKEIWDGFYKPGGFSWGDAIANSIGSVIFISQEILFKEQLFKYKFSFSRSKFVDMSNGYLGDSYIQNYFHDYNGHTYWFSINANKLVLKRVLPSWISLAAGYSGDGMIGDYVNLHSYKGLEIPETPRYRQYLLSMDIDWSQINTKSKLLRTLFKGMNFIKIPFPTIEINSKGKVKGYWLYF